MAEADRATSAAARMSQRRSSGAKLGIDNIDDLGRAVLLLATEVAVLMDRQRVLEAVLEERGIAVKEAVRDCQPAGALADELAVERKRLAQLIVEALCPPEG
jgi:hypothetical protein